MDFCARDVRKRSLAGIVWLAIFVLAFIHVSFLNDHFDRISRGRQVLAYGDHPFADFRDPGYFLTLYVSAAAQAVTGGGLLGEAIVTSAAIATATALTFWLAEAASGSLMLASLAAAFMLLVPARYYDYDKVLFYMLGLAACWRYADAPTRGHLAAAGVITAIAALFRYDNGLYLLVASLASIVVRQRASARTRVLSDIAFYLAAVVITLMPALIFIQLTAGLGEAARQVLAYAAREGQRSELLSLPPLSLDSTSILYAAIVASAPVALLCLAVRRGETRPPFAEAKILAAALLGLCVSVFVLRDPVRARLGAAAPIAIVLVSWIVAPWWRRLETAFADIGALLNRRRAVIALVVCFVVLGLVFPQRAWRFVRAPCRIASRMAAMTTALAATPPSAAHVPDDGALIGMATYVRECTSPDSRIVATWFAPELFFLAERGFAGGMMVFLGSHWSSDDDQAQTIALLQSQQVPLVIMNTATVDDFRENFPQVAAYVDGHYRFAGATSFGDPRVDEDRYRVLIKPELTDARVEPRWRLPCPR